MAETPQMKKKTRFIKAIDHLDQANVALQEHVYANQAKVEADIEPTNIIADAVRNSISRPVKSS